MTAAPAQRLVELSAEELNARLGEALALYVSAMAYPPGTAEQRAPMWLAHVLREGWRCVAALGGDDELVGIGYGYRGSVGQWWHEQVRHGLTLVSGPNAVEEWMQDYFELTELHVLPRAQGRGIGEGLLRSLLAGVPTSRVLLSTPEGPSKAWRLYRRLGFADVLRHYQFTGDPRPFAVLGRTLPLD
ncbi:GNAT family N-acetyltransferase [Saccharothrix algeriensis]|uniref:GNAT family N-acetyltransferase n=1 Tax=Saccharothrix algeriensis TaxID=173560 RepID=A0A8T8I2J7_9PSEU|nr:GNAT family N-acetyltransferase [Saccharothrix algeriensis]MBM7810761.1 ribosomal protein S18 acetylase RimI-like enzyme [Saccharothrix algeriensis]QTR04808.1 GNAT family N-acetyltransferase [Saccharothrix algeriensis]